jgi:predicted transcriptional regulator
MKPETITLTVPIMLPGTQFPVWRLLKHVANERCYSLNDIADNCGFSRKKFQQELNKLADAMVAAAEKAREVKP